MFVVRVRRIIGLLVAGWLAAPGLSVAADERLDFDRDIRPILSEACFRCHGPDAEQRQAELRLDTREGLFGQVEGQPVVKPGDVNASLLLERITANDPDERMPPADSPIQLTPAQIGSIRRWIVEGATWSGHWAFQPLKRPAPSNAKQAGWARQPIDGYVLVSLEKNGLSPAPEASRETLIRRVTLDLTGLPPALGEIDAFLADRSPDAYERLVDRLLASPRYGERMLWDWLDAARYADSNGYQADPERTMWPWRDWVLSALNANMPFDQFTIEQLAGDLLPDATLSQRIATGFNRNHMHNGEGGRVAEESRVENVMDRVETTATVWLGATMNCSRCHDHKFDPFTLRDYYGLYAIFNNTSENGGGRSGQMQPAIAAPSPEQQARIEALERERDSTVRQLETLERQRFPRGDKQPASESPQAAELPDAVRNVLKLAVAARDPGKLAPLIKHFKPDKESADYVGLLERLSGTRSAIDGLRKSIPRVMIMDTLAKPRATFILEVGTYNKPLAKVEASLPAVLVEAVPASEPVAERHDRLSLSRWLVDPRHPLTARVTVNRYWQTFFRYRVGEDAGRLRRAGRTSVASPSARLVGGGIRRERMERQAAASADRHECHLPPIVACFGRGVSARSAEPAAGPRSAISVVLLDASRSSSVRRGTIERHARWTAGETVSAGRRVGGGDLRQETLCPRPRSGTLPAEPVHVLAADSRADDVL